MSIETKYYCDFKGCGKAISEREVNYVDLNGVIVIQKDQFGGIWHTCPEHAKYIFELFEKEYDH